MRFPVAYLGYGRHGSCHGATLMGAQEWLGKSKNFSLTVSWTSILCHIQSLWANLHQHSALISCRASCASTVMTKLMYCYTNTIGCYTNTIGWPDLQDLVLYYTVRKANTVRAAAIQPARDLSQNPVETSISLWLLESDCYAQLRIQGDSLGQLLTKRSVTPLFGAYWSRNRKI